MERLQFATAWVAKRRHIQRGFPRRVSRDHWRRGPGPDGPALCSDRGVQRWRQDLDDYEPATEYRDSVWLGFCSWTWERPGTRRRGPGWGGGEPDRCGDWSREVGLGDRVW